MGQRRYQASGFIPFVSPPARITRQLAATIVAVKGDFLIDDGSGYATNTAELLVDTALGICAASKTGGVTDGLVSVEIYPLDFKTLYIVPVGSTVKITRGDVGVYADLEACNTIDIVTGSIVSTGLGFFIEDIDVSDEAIVANAYGYAIGRFRMRTTQALA